MFASSAVQMHKEECHETCQEHVWDVFYPEKINQKRFVESGGKYLYYLFKCKIVCKIVT